MLTCSKVLARFMKVLYTVGTEGAVGLAQRQKAMAYQCGHTGRYQPALPGAVGVPFLPGLGTVYLHHLPLGNSGKYRLQYERLRRTGLITEYLNATLEPLQQVFILSLQDGFILYKADV